MSGDATEGRLETVIVTRDLRGLKPLEVNARFMTKEKFDRLTDNIRQDGCLTSVPLIWLEPGEEEGRELILSGNHRVKAALTAEVFEAECKLIVGPLSYARRVALQLSHNSIEGEDDPATLAQLYESIDDIDWRSYSGLDDKSLGLLDEVDLTSISEANLDYATVSIVFLPSELEAARKSFEDARSGADEYWLAAYAQYDGLLEALGSVRAAYNTGNVAVALGRILAVFENNLTDLQSGYLDIDGEPLHKAVVGLETVFGTRGIPAPSAAVVAAALKKAERQGDIEPGEGWGLLERLAAAYLES